MLETCRHILDLAVLNRSLIKRNVIKFGAQMMFDWRRDRLLVSASVSVAAAYVVAPAGVDKAVGAMEVIARIDGAVIAALAKAIIQTIAQLDDQ